MNPVEIIPIAVICVIAGAVSVAVRRPRQTTEERNRASAAMQSREFVRPRFVEAEAGDVIRAGDAVMITGGRVFAARNPGPRYVVPTKAQVHGGLHWVTDTREGTGRVTTGPRYTRRSSALRAARRLNAKDRALADLTRDLPPYDASWGRCDPAIQVMPDPLFGKTRRFLVIDTHDRRVMAAYPTDAAAKETAWALNRIRGDA